MAPTRFPSGVTNVAPNDPLAALGMLDPTKYHVFFDDFDRYDETNNWTPTAVGTSTAALADVDGGILRITTDDAENEGVWLETVAEGFLMEVGKKTWVKARFAVGDAIQSDMVFGLHSTSTTPQAAAMRFLFASDDGSAAMYFNIDDNSTDADSATVVTLADDVFVTVAAYYDGKGNVKLYANDVHVTTMTGVSIPGAEMGVGFGYINGASGVETTDVDYILVIKER